MLGVPSAPAKDQDDAGQAVNLQKPIMISGLVLGVLEQDDDLCSVPPAAFIVFIIKLESSLTAFIL